MSEFTHADACHFVNAIPALQSLLYDLNLLPECCKTVETRRSMMLIVAHWREAEYQRRLERERVDAYAGLPLQALRDLLDHYTKLINSGDAGNWDPETEPVVIAARAALAQPVHSQGSIRAGSVPQGCQCAACSIRRNSPQA